MEPNLPTGTTGETPETDIAALLKQRLAAAKARGASKEEIAQEVAWAQEAVQEENAHDPERQRSLLDQIGSTAQTFSDASTFGLSGLVTDAVAPGDFAENRRIRAEGKESLPAGVRIAAELAGSLATPIPGGAVIKTVKGAGKMANAGRMVADAAIQSGVSGTANAVKGTSLQDMTDALQAGGKSALIGGAIAPVAGAVVSGASNAVSRVRGMGKLDKAAFSLKDRIAELDAKNYGVAEGEARSTEPLRDVLENDPQIKPLAAKIKADAAYQGVEMNDAEAAMAAYRRLSSQQRRATATLRRAESGDAGYDPELSEGTIENIKTAKGRILTAAETPELNVETGEVGAAGIPSLRKAIDEHRTGMDELDAFTEGADVARSVGSGKSVAGEKLLTDSEEAYLRKIPQMTPKEAELALAAVLGRGRESAKITASPLGAFGLVSSAIRLPMQMLRTGAIVKALEERAGMGKGLGDRLGEYTRGATARTVGAERP